METVCFKCGHLLLSGYCGNTTVWIEDRVNGYTYPETYGKSCAPEWYLKEISRDGDIKFYKEHNGKLEKIEKKPHGKD